MTAREGANPPTKWEPVIGMEVHVQLGTRSKMFCGCSSDYLRPAPNGNVCPVCLGLPGVLPVINSRAVELCVKSALALNCEIAERTKFDRKNYFYPDLPKGYQISQYDLPMSFGGHLDVAGRRVRITRVHLEEDTGKLVHAGDRLHSADRSYVDLNRAGLPLMEIVTEPDLHSAAEARDYATTLRALLRAVGASEAEMEKGQLRAEANVSIRPAGSSELGVKTELKNINSFRALFMAVEYEIKRQGDVLEGGGTVVQETRGWSEPEKRTFTQRSKEGAQDYRYFPEPDLPPLTLTREWVDTLRASLPELPAARRARLMSSFGLSDYDASLLTTDAAAADYFESVVAAGVEAKPAANWVVGEVLPREQPWQISPSGLADLLKPLAAGSINRDQARRVFEEAWTSGRPPAELVAGVAQVTDAYELAAVVDSVLAAHPQAVADFRSGKQQAIGALIQGVKAATGGRGDLKLASELLRKRLSE